MLFVPEGLQENTLVQWSWRLYQNGLVRDVHVIGAGTQADVNGSEPL